MGDSASWPIEAHLLAVLLDATNVANWQRSGKRNAPKPKPVQRPGQRQPGRHIGRRGGGMSMSEFDAVYQQARAKITEWEQQEVIGDGS